MSQKIVLSIIIPVYNTERFLEKCIKSCLINNYPYIMDGFEYEIIAINDGSTDGSSIILDTFANNLKNFRIINQSNKGLSEARNNGLKVARGEYVWFLDSDDWISSDALFEILNIYNSYSPEIILINALAYLENGDIVDRKTGFHYTRNIYTGKEIFLINKYSMCATLYIYKRSYLNENELHFFPGVFHEDVEFTPRAIYLAKQIYYSKSIYYNIYQRSGSITRTFNIKKSHDLLLIVNNLINFCKLNVMELQYVKALNFKISIAVNSAIFNAKQNEDSLILILRLIAKQKQIIESVRGSKSIKHKFESIFLPFPTLFYTIYKIIR